MNLTPTDDHDVDDDDMLENLSNRNLSGSYSNLFRDILDDDDGKLNSTEQKIHQKDLSENVYSNIPSTTLPTAAGDNSEKSDPNSHVYSNIIEATAVTSSESLNKPTSGNVIDATIMMDGSSTMIANDLDLDDPALAVATFGMAKPKDSSKLVNEKVVKSKVDRSSVNNKRMPKSSSMEMKNVIPQAAIIDQSSNGGSNATTATTTIAANTSSFCSPSRMRLLHDTTMIESALDLDSLDDGSSVGNNSQACLVKTAIV